MASSAAHEKKHRDAQAQPPAGGFADVPPPEGAPGGGLGTAARLGACLVRDIASRCGVRAALLVGLMVIAAGVEGVGLALLLPLLNAIGIGDPTAAGPLGATVAEAFAARGLALDLTTVLALVFVTFALQTAAFLAQSWLAARLQNGYAASWSEDLFGRYVAASWPFFVRHRTGELVNTTIGETSRLGGAFHLAAQIVSAALVVLVYASLCVAISWRVTVILVAAGGGVTLASAGLVRKGYGIGRRITEKSHEVLSLATEFIGGAKLLKATATEEEARARFSRAVREQRDLAFWSSFQPRLVDGVFQLALVAILCGVLWVGVRHFRSDSSNILLVLFVFFRLYPKLALLQQDLQLLNVYLPSLEAAVGLARKADDAREEPGPAQDEAGALDRPIAIAVAGVAVRYDQGFVLSGVTLDVPAGRTVAVVGASGAGKSTLVDCILGLVRPTDGQVLVNGVPVERLPRHRWRRLVGYVAQDTFLFHDTIRHNILWGAARRDDEALLAAARRANAHGFIAAMPSGYDTVVGDRGIRLSGGEKQRIGLARALVGGPSLLILDEATSALDSLSERAVLDAIEELHGRMTIVVIAHRLSTVRRADAIHVLDGGKLEGSGSFEELLDRSDRFRALWQIQSAES